jgi:hypothetical protein
MLQTLILSLRDHPYDPNKQQSQLLQHKLLQSERLFRINDLKEDRKIAQQVGLIEYLGQLNEKMIMYSFALQIDLNFFCKTYLSILSG